MFRKCVRWISFISIIRINQFLLYKKGNLRLLILISIFADLITNQAFSWYLQLFVSGVYGFCTIILLLLIKHCIALSRLPCHCWWKHAHKCTHKWLEIISIWVAVPVTNFWRVKMEYRGDSYIYPIRWHRRSWMERPWRRQWPRYCCEGTVPPRTSRRCCWPLCTDSARWSAYRTNPRNTQNKEVRKTPNKQTNNDHCVLTQHDDQLTEPILEIPRTGT